jgi:hypothetical protein
MHPTHLTLDRFSVDDLPLDERRPVQSHLLSCERCRAFLEQTEACAPDKQTVERFMAGLRIRHARVQRQRRGRIGIGLSAAAGLLAAASWLLLARPPIESTRWKGAGFSIQRQRNGEAKVLEQGDTIQAADALRVVVTQPRVQPVSAWMVDLHGRLDAVLASGPIVLSAGQQALPGSMVVEAPCVDAWLVVAVGDEAAQLETTLRRAVDRGVSLDNGWLPAGVMAQRLRCQ